MTGAQIIVHEADRELRFSFEDMLKYHGGGSPGGVAHAFKVLARGLPLLDGGRLVERREIRIETSFRGPGARDGLELVTRAVTEGRLTIDSALERPDLGAARERFVFRLCYRASGVLLTLRDGFVTDAFIALTRQDPRTEDDEHRLTVMKSEMASRVMSAAAEDVYDAVPVSPQAPAPP